MGIYFKLGQAELARALDIEGRNKALVANVLPLVVALCSVVYWFMSGFAVASILVSLSIMVLSVLVGAHLQAVAIIQSVYRCKDGKNAKIYLKHKSYFDKKFKKHIQASHKSSRNQGR